MNFYINQTIQINYLRLESISNSSILQIGSAGSIKSLSNLYNTGRYVELAPEVSGSGQPLQPQEPDTGSLVPLQPPGTVNHMKEVKEHV
nr:spore germination protein GerPB [Bacillus subtilis]